MAVSIGRGARGDDDLVDLLLACHARIRAFTAMAESVGSRSDISDEDVVDACRRCERYFVEAFPLHVEDEEQSVLPRLVGRRGELDEALAAMRDQHRSHEPLIAALLDAVREVGAHPSDRGRRTEFARAAARCAGTLEEHLRLEEAVVIPAVRALLSEQEMRAARDELRARRHRSGVGHGA